MSLTKSAPSVSLEKKGGSLGEIKVNLNWNQGTKKGLLGSMFGPKAIDLDLCCLYEMMDGEAFGVQALGNNFGRYNGRPWIELSGDDRSGAVSDGEWLRINGDQWSNIRRVLVFAMIYEGVPNWSATDGVVRILAPNQPEIEVKLEGTGQERICAVAMFENEGGNFKITRENRYFQGAPMMGNTYRFPISWGVGRK
ncbi:MAG: hypothetical protein AAF677_01095 [Pseudomonadota bacterium]